MIDHIGEGPVTVVAIEFVGLGKIVGHVKIGPTVVVKIPPGGGMPLRLPGNPRAFGHIGEGTVAVVVEQVVFLTVRMFVEIQQIGLNKDIKPAIAVVVAKGRHDGSIIHIEPVGMGHFLEGSVALIDIKEVGGIEPADVNVQPAVVIHVDKSCALLPDPGGIALVADPGFIGYILEFPTAEIAKQPAALSLAHDENIRPAVTIIVADRDPGAK